MKLTSRAAGARLSSTCAVASTNGKPLATIKRHSRGRIVPSNNKLGVKQPSTMLPVSLIRHRRNRQQAFRWRQEAVSAAYGISAELVTASTVLRSVSIGPEALASNQRNIIRIDLSCPGSNRPWREMKPVTRPKYRA